MRTWGSIPAEICNKVNEPCRKLSFSVSYMPVWNVVKRDSLKI